MNSGDGLTYYESTIRRFSQNYGEQDVDINYLRLQLGEFVDYTENEIFKRLSKELKPKENCIICFKELNQKIRQLYCMFCGNNYCQSHFIKKRKFKDNITDICMICEQNYLANMLQTKREADQNDIRIQISKLQQDQKQLIEQVTLRKQTQVTSNKQLQDLKQEVDELQNECRLYLTMNNQYKRMIEQYKLNIEQSFKIKEKFDYSVHTISLEKEQVRQRTKQIEMKLSRLSLQDTQQQISQIQKYRKSIQAYEQQLFKKNISSSYNNQFNSTMKHSDSQMKTEPVDEQRLPAQEFQSMQERGNRNKYKKNQRIKYEVGGCKACQIY